MSQLWDHASQFNNSGSNLKTWDAWDCPARPFHQTFATPQAFGSVINWWICGSLNSKNRITRNHLEYEESLSNCCFLAWAPNGHEFMIHNVQTQMQGKPWKSHQGCCLQRLWQLESNRILNRFLIKSCPNNEIGNELEKTSICCPESKSHYDIYI